MHQVGKTLSILTFASATMWSVVSMSADIDVAILKQCENPTIQAPDRLILSLSTNSRYTRAERACADQLNRKQYLEGVEEKYWVKQDDDDFRNSYAAPTTNQDFKEQIDATNSISTTARSNSDDAKDKTPAVKTVQGYMTILE